MNEQKDNHRFDKFRLYTHLIFAFLIFIHVVFFVIYWIANQTLIPAVDGYIKGFFKLGLPYVILLTLASALLGIWSLIRVFQMSYRLKKITWKRTHANWIYVFLSAIFLAIFYVSFFMITSMDKSQRGVLLRLLSITRMLIDPLLLILIAYLLRTGMKQLTKSGGEKHLTLHNLGYVLLCVVLLVAWIVPLIFLPQYVYFGKLPDKPKLLAHRGASMLAPENTLYAVTLAHELGAFAFESDVRISQDGVPFLMHDETLKRTTDVEEVFPGREDEHAETFKMDELKQLNAGWWFILDDPHKSVKNDLVDQADLTEIQSQGVPTLEETLDVIKKTDLTLLYDLRNPPEGHPYREGLFRRVYDILKSKKMDSQIWLLLEKDQIEMVTKETPKIVRVLGVSSSALPDADQVLKDGYQVINVDKGICNPDIKAYKKAGLAVNAYVIDQPWLLSQFWIRGTDSITTNAVHTLSKLNSPVWVLSFWLYLLIWCLVGIALGIWLVSAGKWIKKEKIVPEVEGEPITATEPVAEEFPAFEPLDESEVEIPVTELPAEETIMEGSESLPSEATIIADEAVPTPEGAESLLAEIEAATEEIENEESINAEDFVKETPNVINEQIVDDNLGTGDEMAVDFEPEIHTQQEITENEQTAEPDTTPSDNDNLENLNDI